MAAKWGSLVGNPLDLVFVKDADPERQWADETLFRAMIASSPIPLVAINAAGDITYLSPRFSRSFGYVRDDVPDLATLLSKAIPEENYRTQVADTWQAAVGDARERKDDAKPIDIEIVCKNGENRHVSVYPSVMGDASLIYFFDITASKHANASLVNEQLRLTAILNSTVDAIILIDQTGGILSFNPAAEKIFCYESLEVIGHNVRMLMPPHVGEHHNNYLAHYLETGEAKTIGKGREVVGLRSTGEQFPMELFVSPWRDGNQVYFTGVVRDISQQKAVQAQLMQTQKMESLTHLSGGLAHDFNNLLGIIIGNLDLLEDRLKNDEKSQLNVKTALRAALRGADITRRMLTLSRLHNKTSDSEHTHDINALTDDIVAILRRTLGTQYSFFTAFLPDLPRVKLDPSQFENVLLNLALNARDAMPKGGQIIILTRLIPRDNLLLPGLQLSDDVSAYVLLEFSDTGHGMAPEVRERALDPFFTTKTGKGTGLGLAMAYSFAKERKGHIHILSEVGLGTAIHLYLPAGDYASTNAPTPTRQVSELPIGNETILVVDDEHDLLALTTSYLQSLGYHVLSANNAHDALAFIETDKVIDLLLTDVVMPGGTLGTELAVSAQRIRADLPVILCSGFPKRVQDDILYSKFASDILQKPYRKSELAHAVRRKLDART